MDNKIEKAIYRLLQRRVTAKEYEIDYLVEIQILCMNIFGKLGTLLQCLSGENDFDILTIKKENSQDRLERKSSKRRGSLELNNLMNSPLFERVSVNDGYELLIGKSSIWILSYNPYKNSPISDMYGVSIYPEEDIKLMKSLVEFNPEGRVRNRVYILSKTRDHFVGKPKDISLKEVDIKLNYNDDLPYEEILNVLLNKEQTGMLLFHGGAGTGKTTFIRHLIWKNKMEDFKTVIITSCFVDEIGTPEFLDYCLEQEPGTLFVLEDCEKALQSREFGGGNRNISDILNIADGLLSNVVEGIKFVCTFNTPLCNIDTALLRSGRLLVNYEFNKLSLDKTKALVPEATKEMSLNEIYAPEIIGSKIKTGSPRIGY